MSAAKEEKKEEKPSTSSKRTSVFVSTVFGKEDDLKESKTKVQITIQNKSKEDVLQYLSNEMYFGKILEEPKDVLLGPGKAHTCFIYSDTDQAKGGITYDVFRGGDKKANNKCYLVFSSRKDNLKCNCKFGKTTLKAVFDKMTDGKVTTDKELTAWTDDGKLYYRWWGDKK